MSLFCEASMSHSVNDAAVAIDGDLAFSADLLLDFGIFLCLVAGANEKIVGKAPYLTAFRPK